MYITNMFRTTVMLPSDLRIRALNRARESGMSLGEIIRDALSAWLARPTKKADDSLLADEAVFDGPAPADLSASHDKYLYGEEE